MILMLYVDADCLSMIDCIADLCNQPMLQFHTISSI